MPKISLLPAGTTGTGAETYPAVQAGTTVKLTATNLAQSFAASDGIRTRLAADRTYYVRTTGSDSNTGLANTAAGAFLTPQHAWNVVAYTLDLNGHNVIIQIGDGTYTTLDIGDGPIGAASATAVTIQGNLSNKAAVVFTTVNCGSGNIQGHTQVYLRFFKLVNPAGSGLSASGCGVLFDGLDFGACLTSHLLVEHGAFVTCVTPYTISGGTQIHGVCGTHACLALHATTITFSGAPTFSLYFLEAYASGSIYIGSVTFTGALTNTVGKALVLAGGYIDIAGASNGVGYLPGTGTVTVSGGVYGQTQRAVFGNTAYQMIYGDNLIAQLAALTAPRTITLIPVANVWPGYRLLVIDESGTATGVNKIIVAAAGGEFIGIPGGGFAATADAVIQAFGSAEFQSNGVTWTQVR